VSYGRIATGLLCLAGPLWYLSWGYTEMMGSDMWWHVAAGRELLQTGTLWMVDDWSYTELGSDWLNHEWLADIIYYLWTYLWGIETLVYWKWLVVIATFTLLQLALARQSGNHFAGLACAGLAVAIAAPFIDVRPHLYTLLNYCLLLYLLLGRRANPWILAPLFVVWVNLHGGFFFGLMALGILIFPWRDLSVPAVRSAFFIGLLCLVAAALNPSGIGTFLYPLKYAFDDTSPFRQLAEWQPPDAPGGIRSPLFFTFRWVALAGLVYFFPPVYRRIPIPWEGIALTALTLAMAMTSRRFIPIFAISLAVMLAPLVGLLLGWLRGRAVGVAVACAALLWATWRMIPYPLQAGPAFHYLVAEYTYPIDLMDFAVKNRLQGRLFSFYNWGGYVHWRTDGALKVYIDGRADTLYDADTYNNYVAIMRSPPDWVARVEASGAQFMMWPHTRYAGAEKLAQLQRTGRWRLVYRDIRGWLAVRAGTPLPRNLERTQESPWQLLTLARGAMERRDPPNILKFARAAREEMPWNQGACRLEAGIAAQEGREEDAREVLADCLSYFPSRSLQ